MKNKAVQIPFVTGYLDVYVKESLPGHHDAGGSRKGNNFTSQSIFVVWFLEEGQLPVYGYEIFWHKPNQNIMVLQLQIQKSEKHEYIFKTDTAKAFYSSEKETTDILKHIKVFLFNMLEEERFNNDLDEDNFLSFDSEIYANAISDAATKIATRLQLIR